MSLDCIDELEHKLDTFINSLNKTRNENKEIKGRIQELEKENGDLKTELQALQGNSSDNRAQLETAAEKIKKLISRLETIE